MCKGDTYNMIYSEQIDREQRRKVAESSIQNKELWREVVKLRVTFSRSPPNQLDKFLGKFG